MSTKSRAVELSTSKVLASGMAAATSAVLGSNYGAFGTVGGAAVGSVVTTVGTTVYQRSLERAHTRVTAHLPVAAGRGVRSTGAADPGATGAGGQPTVPLPHLGPDAAARTGGGGAGPPSDRQPTQELPANSPPPPARRVSGRRRLRALVLGTVLGFLLALALVTGAEWVKGSPLSGGPGTTSLGEVLHRAPAAEEPSEDTDRSTDDRDSRSTENGSDPTSTDRLRAPTVPGLPSAVPTPTNDLRLPLPVPGRGGANDSRSGDPGSTDSGG